MLGQGPTYYLNHIRQKGLEHNDLHDENVMVNTKDPSKPLVLFIDFNPLGLPFDEEMVIERIIEIFNNWHQDDTEIDNELNKFCNQIRFKRNDMEGTYPLTLDKIVDKFNELLSRHLIASNSLEKTL